MDLDVVVFNSYLCPLAFYCGMTAQEGPLSKAGAMLLDFLTPELCSLQITAPGIMLEYQRMN